MATYNFSSLSDGQSISFRPGGADVLRFDQSVISAADVRIAASGTSTRIQVVSGQYAGKDILLLNTTPYQLYTGNVTFASDTRLLVGDNSVNQNDNGSHTLNGTAGRDVFYGFGGNDSMNGGEGNDVFVMVTGTASSYGSDSIDGGNGFDIVDFSGARSAVNGSLAARSVSGGGVNGTGSAFVTGVDGIIGGAFNDNLRGNGAANRLEGGAGNDTVDGASGRDTLIGGAGNDTYIVYAGDVLSDSSGTDTVISNGSWTLASGFENLTLARTDDSTGIGNSANNVIIGNSGSNTLRGNGGNDTIEGGAGGDVIEGGSGNDVLYGGDEEFGESWFDPLDNVDAINGGSGNDRMFGGTGSDGFILSGDYGEDFIDGGAHQDLLFAGGSSALVVDLAAGTATGGGSSGRATFVNVEGAAGGRFADWLLGNAADNLFMGRAGNDSMSGGAGNDHLMSEGGNDALTGGSGADEFRFAAPAGTADADRITDFVPGSDKIVLDGSFTSYHEEAATTFGDFAPNDDRFYAARGATAAHDDTDRVIYDTSSGRLYYDPDGTGPAPVLIMATLQGAPALAATDFTVW